MLAEDEMAFFHSFMIQEAGMFQLLFLHVGHQLVANADAVKSTLNIPMFNVYISVFF